MLRAEEASENRNVGMNFASVLLAARERLRTAFSFTGDSIMFQRVQLFVCVACVVAVCLTVGVLRADVVYNADNDYPDSSSPTFGTWSLGYRTNAQGVDSTQFTLYNTCEYIGSPAYIANWYLTDSNWNEPNAAFNVSGGSYIAPLSPREFGMGPGIEGSYSTTYGSSLDGAYSILRWTAPQDGKATILSVFADRSGGQATDDIHLVLNGASLWDGTIIDSPTSTNIPVTVSGVLVHAGDVIDLVVGNNGSGGNDLIGVHQSITLVRRSRTLQHCALGFGAVQPVGLRLAET